MMRIWVSKPSSSSSSSTQSSSRPSPDSFLSDLPQRFRLRYRNRFVPPRPAKEKAIDLNEYVDSSDGGEDINPECYLYEELHVTPVCQEDQSKKNKNKKQNVWKGKGREGEEDTDVTKRKRREEHEFFKTGRDFIHTHRHVEFRKPTKKKQEQVQLQDQLQSHITTTYTPISCSVAPLLTPSTSNPLPSSSSSSTKPLKRRWSAPLHFVTLPLLGRNSTSSEPDPPTTRRPTPPVTLSFDLVSALSDFLGSDFAVSKLGFIPDDKRCLAVCRKLGMATPLLAVVPSCGSSSAWSHSYVFFCQARDGDVWGYSMVEGLWKFGVNELKLDWRGLRKFVTRSLRGRGLVRGWDM